MMTVTNSIMILLSLASNLSFGIILIGLKNFIVVVSYVILF